MDDEIELAEGSEAVILNMPNVSNEQIVGLLLKTRTVEIEASTLPHEPNLRIALRPQDARKLAQSLHRAAKRCLKNRRLN